MEADKFTEKEIDWVFKNNVDQNKVNLSRSLKFKELSKAICPTGEIFVFDYGVIVLWGFTEKEELSIIFSLKNHQNEHLGILLNHLLF